MKPNILLVEDDLKLARLVKDYLEASGEFTVSIEMRGDLAIDRISLEKPDMVLLDVMLPGMDGLSVCKQARRAGYDGIILMLTALGEEVDQIVGLEIGADDYVVKPASPRLLLARIRSHLRKKQVTANERIRTNGLIIDKTSRLVAVNGEEIRLTTGEFDLLWLLASHAGEPMDRDKIYEELRGSSWDGLDRSVDLRIARLRKKLGDDPNEPRWIKSVRGTGYLFAPNVI